MTTLFLDIDTQLDFVSPAGALYVPGAERLLPAVARLNRWAAEHGIPVVSTADAHAEDDPEFSRWPHHCVAGTLGQRKAAATLLDGRIVIPNARCALDIAGARQIVVEKQSVDAFGAPNFAAVLEKLAVDRAVVYGVVTEICVLHAVRGLRHSGRTVTVVADAIETLAPENGRRALEEMQAAGARVSSAAEIVG